MTSLAAVCGAGIGLGLVLLVVALRGTAPGARRDWRLPPQAMKRAGIAVGAGLIVGVVTRWPVAALASMAEALSWPALFGGAATNRAQVARIEAIAAWTEMLRDTLVAASGLEQAITHTAPLAPAPIAAEVRVLASRLTESRTALNAALREFAAALADPTGDLVVATLILSAQRQRGGLAEVLRALAASARDQAAMRLRVEAGRARTRTSVRVISITTLAMAAGLILLNRNYLGPYDSATGQLVLVVVAGCFGVALYWLAQMSRFHRPERFLVGLSRIEEGTSL